MEWDFCATCNVPAVQEAVLLPTINSFCSPKVYTSRSSSNAGYYLGTWDWWYRSRSEVYFTQPSVCQPRYDNHMSRQLWSIPVKLFQTRVTAGYAQGHAFKIRCRLYHRYLCWVYWGVCLSTKHTGKISL